MVFASKTGTFLTELQDSMGPRPHLRFFFIQNSAFSSRIASLNGSQPSSVVYLGETAPFGSELQAYIGSRPHLSLCACKTA